MTTLALPPPALLARSVALQHRHEVFWTRVFFFGASCIAGLIIARKRKLHRFHLHILTTKAHDFGRFFGMDIGGTLAKMVYFQPSGGEISKHMRQPNHEEGCLSHIEAYILGLHSSDRMRTAQREEYLELHVPELGGTIHFFKFVPVYIYIFQTSKMEEIIDFVRHRFFHRYIKKISCTGGGAYKKLGIEIYKADEMDALIKGMNFVLQHAKDECYTFKNVVLETHGLCEADKTIVPTPTSSELYPFLLVNIGSGVSILKVSGENTYERVSGTSLGGGTFWGLCRAMSKLQSFDEAMDASLEGDSNAVDMTVGDIYGDSGYGQFNLKSSTVASSFGKMGATKPNAPPKRIVRDEDLARSLLFMITQNVCQVAYLNARRVGTKRIYFCGNFLRRNEMASRQLSYAIEFWSKGEMEAQFFHHEGFFGALGSFLSQYKESNLQKHMAASVEAKAETTSSSSSLPDVRRSGSKNNSNGSGHKATA
uniref:pantothenate kinase n=1 Tax=Globisporangium ultimum (strain ATCC 200006 / CBS 805.95 / DAOM BR144) TaxID=431595 RepID=K3WE04_GLOUD